MGKNSSLRFFKRIHKWPAIIIAFFAILFATSGIVMNHRQTFSSFDISRNILPENYSYKNWNLAAIRGAVLNEKDGYLVFGNIGIWKTNSQFNNFTDFNQGFPKGIDNRKIYSVIKFNDLLFAGTHFGLFSRNSETAKWVKITIPVTENRISDLSIKNDTLLVLTRHYLLKSHDGKKFEKTELPAPPGYKKRTGLFNTFWELHSGELLGLTGKLIVDLLGLVTIFLSITGLLHFFFPKIIKKRKKKTKNVNTLVSVKKFNLRWHNIVGYIFVLFLLINTFSGMHLRPPLLIAIANKQVKIIPGTHLDSQNPWFDKLRRVQWNDDSKQYIFSTSDGIYFADESLTRTFQPPCSQPPVSIMGCNVLKQLGAENYLVGSFSGMFLWNIQTGSVSDFFTGQKYIEPERMQSPIAANMAAGLVEGNNTSWWFDYNSGAIALNEKSFPEMTKEIRKASPMSLWNVAQEIHTGRIFENILGPFYILYVPLAGICILLVLISGVWIWWKMFRKKKSGR